MIKVLHCPDQVGGNPGVLSKYENLIGLSSTCYAECVNLFSDIEHEEIIKNHENKSILFKEFSKLTFLLKSCLESGVVHFNNGRMLSPHFGESIHPKEEKIPPLLRKLARHYAQNLFWVETYLWRLRKKAVFITFQGSDARETNCFQEEYILSGLASKIVNRSGRSDRSIRQKKVQLNKIVDKIYSLNPDLLEVLPKGSEFLPYSTETGLKAKISPIIDRDEFVVGHAPTHRITKGTDEVVRTVKRLQENGHKVRLELIEGLSKTAATQKYKEIDIFVDQLIIGWYGVVSLEVMALGKPVICFIKGRGLRFVPKQMLRDLPVINADAKNLEECILGVMKMDRVQRGALAERGIQFIHKWHDPKKIALKVAADYREALSQRKFNLV